MEFYGVPVSNNSIHPLWDDVNVINVNIIYPSCFLFVTGDLNGAAGASRQYFTTKYPNTYLPMLLLTIAVVLTNNIVQSIIGLR